MFSTSGYLAIRDIAELAGVTRAAVSNWRSRYDDFPAPLEGFSDRRPLFDLHEIVSWLKQRDLLGLDAQKKQTKTTLWGVTNLLPDRVANPVDVAILVLSLLAIRKKSESDTSDSTWETITATSTLGDFTQTMLNAEVPVELDHSAFTRAFEKIHHDLVDSHVVKMVTSLNKVLITDYGYAAEVVVDRLLSRGGRGNLSALNTETSPPSVLLINAAATTVDSGSSVYDPACGIGGTLFGLHRRQHSLTLIGNDLDNTPLTVARLHAYLADVPATFTQSDAINGDVHEDLRCHTVVAEAPMRAAVDSGTIEKILTGAGIESEGWLPSDELFLYNALNNLAPGGYAYVLTQVHAGSGKGSRQVRQELIARGLVEAVIQLPPRWLPYSVVPTLLWVLHRPIGEPDTSLMIASASSVSKPEDEIAQWLTDFRAGRETSIPSRRLSIAEVITNEGVIVPTAILRAEVEGGKVRKELDTSISALSSTFTTVRNIKFDEQMGQRVPTSTSFTTLEKLIDSRAVTQRRGYVGVSDTDKPEDIVEAGLLTPSQPHGDEVRIRVRKTDVRLEDGDILMPLHTLNPAWMFKPDGNNWVPHSSLHVLRVNDPDLDPRYLLFCINAPFNQPESRGLTRPYRDFDQIQIPALDLNQQRDLATSLETLSSLKDNAELLTQQAEAAAAAILSAVRFDNPTG